MQGEESEAVVTLTTVTVTGLVTLLNFLPPGNNSLHTIKLVPRTKVPSLANYIPRWTNVGPTNPRSNLSPQFFIHVVHYS